MQLLPAPSEPAFDYFAATRAYLDEHGKPVAFYSDKASVFRVAARQPDPPGPIGGIGVLVTLLYLARQIRQNSQLLRANTLETSASAMSAFNRRLGSDRDLARLFQTGLESFPQLAPDEKRQFINLLRASFTDQEHLFLHFERGFADEAIWQGNRQIARDLLESPYVAVWWEHRKHLFAPSFVRDVEQTTPTEGGVLADAVIAAMESVEHRPSWPAERARSRLRGSMTSG